MNAIRRCTSNQGVDLGSKDNRGVLVINVNTGMLNTILSQETFDTIIVDSKNNIVAANRDYIMDERVIYWDYIMDERDQKVYLSLIKGLILEAKTTVACL